MTVEFWRRYRNQYHNISQLVAVVDENISFIIVLSLSHNISLICAQLLNSVKLSWKIMNSSNSLRFPYLQWKIKAHWRNLRLVFTDLSVFSNTRSSYICRRHQRKIEKTIRHFGKDSSTLLFTGAWAFQQRNQSQHRRTLWQEVFLSDKTAASIDWWNDNHIRARSHTIQIAWRNKGLLRSLSRQLYRCLIRFTKLLQ